MSGEGTLPASDHCFPAGGAIPYLVPFPLHTPSEAFTGVLYCTTLGFSPPWGEASNPALYTFSNLTPDLGLL